MGAEALLPRRRMAAGASSRPDTTAHTHTHPRARRTAALPDFCRVGIPILAAPQPRIIAMRDRPRGARGRSRGALRPLLPPARPNRHGRIRRRLVTGSRIRRRIRVQGAGPPRCCAARGSAGDDPGRLRPRRYGDSPRGRHPIERRPAFRRGRCRARGNALPIGGGRLRIGTRAADSTRLRIRARSIHSGRLRICARSSHLRARASPTEPERQSHC